MLKNICPAKYMPVWTAARRRGPTAQLEVSNLFCELKKISSLDILSLPNMFKDQANLKHSAVIFKILILISLQCCL